MKFVVALSIAMLAAAAHQTATAAGLSAADFDVISVVPRSPSVKPQLMPIPAKPLDRGIASKAGKSSESH